MEAKELRVGNFVLWNDEIAIVRQILELEIIFECGDIGLIADCQPIPLLSKWLLKFGFEETEFVFRIGNFFLTKSKQGERYLYQAHQNRFQVRFVHQLQNLWYALEEEDLIYKKYVLVETERLHQQGIKCLTCGRTSYNPNDIKNLYCGHCNKFHN